MSFVEESGDLFSLDPSWALAHCVSEDFVMGKGIALEFRKRFGNVKFLRSLNRKIGQSASVRIRSTTIFYLVTKVLVYSKPTYESLAWSLVDMFNQAQISGITNIAMPRIGCGLDGLNWDIVKSLIIKYKPAGINIKVRYLST